MTTPNPWYKEWYKTTPEGEKELRDALSGEDGVEVRNAVTRRMTEIGQVVRAGRGCAISKDQLPFLERVLGG